MPKCNIILSSSMKNSLILLFWGVHVQNIVSLLKIENVSHFLHFFSLLLLFLTFLVFYYFICFSLKLVLSVLVWDWESLKILYCLLPSQVEWLPSLYSRSLKRMPRCTISLFRILIELINLCRKSYKWKNVIIDNYGEMIILINWRID